MESKIKIVKTSLKNIVKSNKEFLESLSSTILNVHEIISTSYNFIRLYVLHEYTHNKNIPDINEKFIKSVFFVITENSGKGPKRKIPTDIQNFYDRDFSKIFPKKFNSKGLSQILKYNTITLFTMYKNCISVHYMNNLRRFINKSFITYKDDDFYTKMNTSERKEYNTKIRDNLRILKNDILNNTNKSTGEYLKWFNDNRNHIIPYYNTLKPKTSYYYDLQVNPMKYLKYSMYMGSKLEMQNNKTFQCLPLRTNLVPKYIPIDTKTLVELASKQDKLKKGKILKKLGVYEKMVWGTFFSTNKKVFKKKGYVFSNLIYTDGIGVSISFKSIGYKKYKGKTKKMKVMDNFPHIEDLSKNKLKELHDKYNFVYTDPGKHTLTYMYDGDKTFKYTSKNRWNALEIEKYSKIYEKMKEEYGIKKIETDLSNYSCKSYVYNTFRKYLETKQKDIEKQSDFYYKDLFRKVNYRKYINKQRSEQKLVNNIKKTFSRNGKDPLIVMGNWNITKQQKHFMPTPCIGLKRRLGRDIKLYSFDEFRTSVISYKTGQKMDNMKNKNGSKIHSVLIHKEKNNVIGCVNRDFNAVRNFMDNSPIISIHFF